MNDLSHRLSAELPRLIHMLDVASGREVAVSNSLALFNPAPVT
jgi:hypothetical protein